MRGGGKKKNDGGWGESCLTSSVSSISIMKLSLWRKKGQTEECGEGQFVPACVQVNMEKEKKGVHTKKKELRIPPTKREERSWYKSRIEEC